MKTIKELQDDFNKNGNIKILQSKTHGIGYIKGRFASLLENVPEIIEISSIENPLSIIK